MHGGDLSHWDSTGGGRSLEGDDLLYHDATLALFRAQLREVRGVPLQLIAEPAWRPAIVTAVWPHEFGGHPLTDVGLNVTVFPDGGNDQRLLAAIAPHAPCSLDLATVRMTSVPHEGVARSEQPAGVWCPTGPTWRWPPRD